MATATIEFPTAPVAELRPLLPGTGLSEATDFALWELQMQGFVVAVGVHESQMDNLADMAGQDHIREFCPNDINRFGTEPKVRKWLQKGTGRVMVGIYAVKGADGAPMLGPLDDAQMALLQAGDLTQVAYGWFGSEPTKHMPRSVDVTTAYRVGQQGRDLTRQARAETGRSLSLGLSLGKMVLAVATELYGIAPERIGLETWQSNEAANKLYDILGFREIASEEDTRSTLKRLGSKIRNKVVFHYLAKILVQDKRLYKVLATPEQLETAAVEP